MSLSVDISNLLCSSVQPFDFSKDLLFFLQIAQENCDSCDASLVAVDFNKTCSPLPAGGTQHTGCVFCDPIFQDAVELKHATMRYPRGVGGRRGARGRGRRIYPKKPKDKMAALAAYFV